jgi:hypothetical protein
MRSSAFRGAPTAPQDARMKNSLLLAASRHSLLAIAVTAPLAACGGTQSPDTTPAPSAPSAPSVIGQWTSACSPMSPTQGAVLDFDIAADTWAIDFTVFADPACAQKFATVHIEGPYTVGAPSSRVSGAHDAVFSFTSKSVTPHLDAAAAFLGSAQGCGQGTFTTGQPTDISATGCAGLGQRPIAACSADYDVVQVDGDRLTFGARPADNDLCTEDKRPTALSPLTSMRR